MLRQRFGQAGSQHNGEVADDLTSESKPQRPFKGETLRSKQWLCAWELALA